MLLDHIGALPVNKELTAHTWEKQEHIVTRPELLQLGWPVVDLLLFPVDCLHVLLYYGGHTLNMLVHLLDVVNEGVEWRWLLLPGFPDSIQ